MPGGLVQDFHELAVWRRAHQLVLRVYAVSQGLPGSENFGLVLNLRRSAVAIARSIAEGSGSGSDAEFSVDLKRARAFGHELEYVLLLCHDLGFLDSSVHEELTREVIEVRKMISGLVKRTMLGQTVR